MPLVVWDQSRTPDSRELVSQFAGSPYFSLVRYVDNERDMDRAIDSGEALMGLIIPYDFARRLASRTEAPLEVAISGVDSNTATIALGYADAITEIYSQEWMIRRMSAARGPTKVQVPLDVRGRVWFNADLESKNYIVPGLIAVIMMVIAAMLTSLCFAREWERGTMEQLISTPVQGSELVLGKLIPYFAIGLLGHGAGGRPRAVHVPVPLRGNVALLFGVASIFLVGVLTMGMLFSIATKSQLLASQLAMTDDLPARLHFVGLHFRHRQHAPADPVDHVSRAGAVFHRHPQGDLSQGRGPGNPGHGHGPVDRVRRGHGALGQCEVQEETNVAGIRRVPSVSCMFRKPELPADGHGCACYRREFACSSVSARC